MRHMVRLVFVIYGFFYASHTKSQRGYGVESYFYSNYNSFKKTTVNNKHRINLNINVE